MNNQSHVFQWAVPMVIGVIGFLSCLYAYLIGQRSDWNLLVLLVISAAFLGASIFNRIALTKDGLIIETAQASLHGLNTLEKAVKANAEALQELKKRVDETANLAIGLTKLPQTPQALAAQGEALSTETTDLTSALQNLGVSVQDVVEGVSAVKKSISSFAEYIGWSGDDTAVTPPN
jgi:hypothetical protein